MHKKKKRVFRWCNPLIIFLLFGFQSVAAQNHGEAVAKGGCIVREVNEAEKVSWTGKCDAQGYATGRGKLFIKYVVGHAGTEAYVFVGHMLDGLKFTIEQGGTEYSLRSFCRENMTDSEIKDHEKSSGRLCRDDLYVEMKTTPPAGNGSGVKKGHGGIEGFSYADSAGHAEFSAYVRSRMKPIYWEPVKTSVKRNAPKPAESVAPPAKGHTSRLAGDACAKIQIVNGKKLCVE